MFPSDEGPTLETLDFAFRLSAVYQHFIFSLTIPWLKLLKFVTENLLLMTQRSVTPTNCLCQA